jgi:hypothetical protein
MAYGCFAMSGWWSHSITVELYRWDNIATDTLLYPMLLHSTLRHSHSIVSTHRNALILCRKFFPCAAKDRLADPSEIRALDFKQEFRRSAICSVSATIGVDRSIFSVRRYAPPSTRRQKNRQHCLPRRFSVRASSIFWSWVADC